MCLGSWWGDCCSDQSYCGSTEAYCGKDCQAGFGKCDSVSSSTAVSSSKSSISSFSAAQASSSAIPSTASSFLVASVSSTTAEPSTSSTVLLLTSEVLQSFSSAISSTETLCHASSTSSFMESSSTSSTTESSSTSSTMESSSSSSVTELNSTSSTSIEPSSTPASSTPTPSPTPASATPTPSATTPSCYAEPTNYAVNGDFETGNGSPWTIKTPGLQATYLSGSAPSGQYNLLVSSDRSGYFGTTQAFQSITIPVGVIIQVSAWVKSYTPGALRFMVFTREVPSVMVTPTTSDWVRISLPSYVNTVAGSQYIVVQGDCASISTACNAGGVYAFDDVRVTALSGPNGQELCSYEDTQL
jgi:hypothetical protein